MTISVEDHEQHVRNLRIKKIEAMKDDELLHQARKDPLLITYAALQYLRGLDCKEDTSNRDVQLSPAMAILRRRQSSISGRRFGKQSGQFSGFQPSPAINVVDLSGIGLKSMLMPYPSELEQVDLLDLSSNGLSSEFLGKQHSFPVYGGFVFRCIFF